MRATSAPATHSATRASSSPRRRGRFLLAAVLLTATAGGHIAGPQTAEATGSLGGTTSVRSSTSRLAAGARHTCAIRDDGRVSCWGDGSKGALGHGSTSSIGDDELPSSVDAIVDLPGNETAIAIAAGYANTCAVLASGAITCWGEGDLGQLGYGNNNDIGDNETPAENPVNGGRIWLPGNRRAKDIAVGAESTCAVSTTGEVFCWGSNSSGQLGRPGADTSAPTTATPMPAGTVRSITAAAHNYCALYVTGQAACWGEGAFGQLGYGNTDDIGDNETVAAAGFLGLGTSVTAIATGGNNSCAILESVTVRCWGLNGQFVLGTGSSLPLSTNNAATSPNVNIIGPLATTVGITVGQSYACATFANGEVSCWGSGQFGALGRGNTNNIGDNESAGATTLMPGGEGALGVVAGETHTCAELASHRIVCWGRGLNGQLGYGTTEDVGDNETPAAHAGAPVAALGNTNQGAVALSSGLGAHSCAIIRNGQLVCWGANSFGQLGYASTAAVGDDEVPATVGTVDLPGHRRALQVSVGEFHTCALLSGGVVSCWGLGSDGRLGTGTSTVGDNESPNRSNPFVQMPGGRRAIAVAAGTDFSCALLEGGGVTCWGAGTDGQLGYGNTNAIGDNETPAGNPVDGGLIDLPGTLPAVGLAAGVHHACAVLSDGTLTCWGRGSDGRLGYGNGNHIGDNEKPAANPVNGGIVPLVTGTRVRTLSLGQAHSCVTTWATQVMCWGSNGFGQLGLPGVANVGLTQTVANGPNSGSIVAVSASSSNGGRQISAGFAHTCVRTAANDVQCWGAGSAGRLGYGNTTTIGDNETPLSVGVIPLSAEVLEVSANNSHTCALTLAGGAAEEAVLCWGYSADGRLGYASGGDRGDNESLQSVYSAGVLKLGGSSAPPDITAIRPIRVFDSRSGQPFDGGVGNGVLLQPNTELVVRIGGRGPVPINAVGAAITVTASEPSAQGWLRAYPCGQTTTSSFLNYTANQATPNTGVIALSETGDLCVATLRSTHVVVDVVGYLAPTSSVRPITPRRLADTRPGESTVDGQYLGVGLRSAGSTYSIDVTGRGGVPAEATNVFLNVVATASTAKGFLTVFPCNAPRPTASNLNYAAGVVRANGALVQVPADGRICIYNHAPTHIVVDVTGYTLANTDLATRPPARLMDSRPGELTIDVQQAGLGQVQPASPVAVRFEYRAGSLLSARQAWVNITAIGTAAGFVTVWDCSSPRPVSSTLNMIAGQAVANTALVVIGRGDQVCIYVSQPADIIVDIVGTTL